MSLNASDWGRVFTSLLTAAIIALVTATFSLYTSQQTLVKQIAVNEAEARVKDQRCEKCDQVIDEIRRMLRAHNDRINKLEWGFDSEKGG